MGRNGIDYQGTINNRSELDQFVNVFTALSVKIKDLNITAENNFMPSIKQYSHLLIDRSLNLQTNFNNENEAGPD